MTTLATRSQPGTGTASGLRRDVFPWVLGVAAVVVVGALTRIPLIVAGPRDYDEGVYWLSVRRLVHGDVLFGAIYSSQPPFFLPLLTPAYRLLGEGLTSLRVATLLLCTMGVVAGAWAAGRLGGRAAALLTAVLLCLDPLWLLDGSTVLAEGPALGLALVAVALAAESTVRRQRGAQLWLSSAAGAAAAVAIGVKLLALPVLLPVAVLVTTPQRRPAPRARLAAAAAGAAAIGIVALVANHAELGPMLRQSVGLHLDSRGLDEGGFTQDFWLTARRELPAALLALLGAAHTLASPRYRRAGVAMSLWLLAAAAAVAVQHPLWPHHLSAVAPPLALLGGLAVAAPAGRVRPALAAAVAVAFAAVCLVSAQAYRHDLEGSSSGGQAVAGLRAALPPGSVVVSDDQATVAQAGLDAPPELVDTSLVRINSGNLTTATVEEVIAREHVNAVLFATGRLDHLPGLRDWVAQRFPVSVSLDGGRVLYLPASG